MWWVYTLVIAGMGGAFGEVAAQDMPVPVETQYTLINKILSYDRAQEEKTGDLVVGIVYQNRLRNSTETKDELLRLQRSNAGVRVHNRLIRWVPVELNDLDELPAAIRKQGIQVVYLCPVRAVDIEKLAGVCRNQRVPTFTGVPAYMDMEITVSIDLKEDNRPEILINVEAARKAGAQYSAYLLKLARIVG